MEVELEEQKNETKRSVSKPERRQHKNFFRSKKAPKKVDIGKK